MCVDQIGHFSDPSATQPKRNLISGRWAVLCSYSGRVAAADCVGCLQGKTTFAKRRCDKDSGFREWFSVAV